MQSCTRFHYNLASILFTLLIVISLIPITTNASVNIKGSDATAIPHIIYNNENGTSQTLDTSKYKLTALHFWATWCVPCIEELPQINETQKKYSAQGFKVIAISMDGKDTNKVKKFYNDNHIDKLDVLFNNDMSIFQKLEIRGLPTTIFINSDSNKIGQSDGPIDWKSKEVRNFIESQIELSNK